MHKLTRRFLAALCGGWLGDHFFTIIPHLAGK